MESVLERAVNDLMDLNDQDSSSDCEYISRFKHPILYSFVTHNFDSENITEEPDCNDREAGLQMYDANNISNIRENNKSIYVGSEYDVDNNENVRDTSNFTHQSNTGELDSDDSEYQIGSQNSSNAYDKPSTQDCFGDFETDDEHEVPSIKVRCDLFAGDATDNFVVVSDSDSDTNTERLITNKEAITVSTNDSNVSEEDFLLPNTFLQKNIHGTTETGSNNRLQFETGTLHSNSSHSVEIFTSANYRVPTNTAVGSILEQDLFVSESELSQPEILERTNEGISNLLSRTEASAANMHVPSILEQDLFLSESEESDVPQSMTTPTNDYSISNYANENISSSAISGGHSVHSARDMPDITGDYSSASSKKYDAGHGLYPNGNENFENGRNLPDITDDTYVNTEHVVLEPNRHSSENSASKREINILHHPIANNDNSDIDMLNDRAPAACNNPAQNCFPPSNGSDSALNNEEIRDGIADCDDLSKNTNGVQSLNRPNIETSTSNRSRRTSDNDHYELDFEDLSDYESYKNIPEHLSPMLSDNESASEKTAQFIQADTFTPPNGEVAVSSGILPGQSSPLPTSLGNIRKRGNYIRDKYSVPRIPDCYERSNREPRNIRHRRGNYPRGRDKPTFSIIIKIIEGITRSRAIDPETKLQVFNIFVKSMNQESDTD